MALSPKWHDKLNRFQHAHQSTVFIMRYLKRPAEIVHVLAMRL